MANMRTIEITCSVCNESKSVTAPDSEFRAWESGQLIQKAMKSLNDNDRELLISATCGTCFDKMFDGFDNVSPSNNDEQAF